MVRPASLLLAMSIASSSAVIPTRAQQPAPAATPPAQAPQAPGPAHRPANSQIHRVAAPPSAAMVKGPAARSTAQVMAAHSDPPLQKMPSFAVAGLDGKSVDVGSFHTSGHWLLLYRAEHCGACDKVMAALAQSDSSLFKQGASYVIVVKRTGNDSGTGMLDQLKAGYPTLSNAAWVEDTGATGFAALKPHGEPVLYAVSGSDIAWAVHGSMNNPAALEKQASAWLASTSKPHPAPAVAANAARSPAAKPTAATKTAPAASH